MIGRVINAQKAVVRICKDMNRYRQILAVVPLDIKLQLFIRRMSVDFCRYSAPSLVEQSQDTFINVVVNQNYSPACIFDQFTGKFVEFAMCKK